MTGRIRPANFKVSVQKRLKEDVRIACWPANPSTSLLECQDTWLLMDKWKSESIWIKSRNWYAANIWTITKERDVEIFIFLIQIPSETGKTQSHYHHSTTMSAYKNSNTVARETVLVLNVGNVLNAMSTKNALEKGSGLVMGLAFANQAIRDQIALPARKDFTQTKMWLKK